MNLVMGRGCSGSSGGAQGWRGPCDVRGVAVDLVGIFQQQNLHFLLLLQQLDKRRQSLPGSKVKSPWS